MNIMMITAEMAPYAKTGGLADVLGSLPRYLAELGHDVRCFIPLYGVIDRNQHGLELGEIVVFIARGIIFADKVNTVSERYATEMRTPEFGERLDSFMRDRNEDPHAILNGIDNDLYDPGTDPNLVLNFDIESLTDKAVNKRALQNEAGLEPDPRRPLCGFIARISHQKGIDLLEATLPAVIRAGGQFILLGTGDPHYENVFHELAAAYPADCCARITFDAALAQRMYAGLDFMLIPSRYEPCGLTQMISLRYGTVPIVRETGGLADTVKNFDPATGAGTGFSFRAYDSLDFMGGSPWRSSYTGARMSLATLCGGA